MKRIYLLLLFPFFASLLFGQSRADLVECLKLALSTPEMEAALAQEWGEMQTLYLGKPSQRSFVAAGGQPDFQELETADFEGFHLPVVVINEEEIFHLPLEYREGGLLRGGAAYREASGAESISLSLSANLPRNPRRWLTGTFVLRRQGDGWAIVQKSVQIQP
jgi:hypothetical protein